MTTAKKRSLFEEIREGLEAYRDRRDTLPRRKLSAPDVKAIREQFGMSHSDMATFLNVSKRTLENWEQGRRSPTGPAQTFLRIMEREPNAVRRALLKGIVVAAGNAHAQGKLAVMSFPV